MPQILNTWKEIAQYMGRGVRTVQRWERDLGLPVRRPSGRDRSAVVALTDDLDRWLKQVPGEQLRRVTHREMCAASRAVLHERTKGLRENVELLHLTLERTRGAHR